MKCQRCGADIPKGEVFCFECGEDVQLVPDYNSVEYMIQQKQALEEIELRKEQERQKKQSRLEKREAELKKKKKHRLILLIVVSAIFMIGLILGLLFFVQYQQARSFEYQYAAAYEAYEEKDYAGAEEFAKRALELAPDNDNAILLMAEIQIHLEEIDKAAELLTAYIESHPESVEAYARLISIYEQEQRFTEIVALMKACSDPNVLLQFIDYVPIEVNFVSAPGEYSEVTMVELDYSDGTVYYTTDGSDPTMDSQPYTEPILLEEGTTTIKAVAYTAKGIPGEILEGEYTVTYPTPNAPFISPVSGDYEEGTEIMVIVPDGCKAYYTFDGIPDSSGNLYEGPVLMPKGEHIFSVILVNEFNKESYPSSEIYVVG